MAERCCMGRDSSCVVNGLQQSTGKFVDQPCYCDEGCLDTGDCCSDYKQICDVQGKKIFFKHCKPLWWHTIRKSTNMKRVKYVSNFFMVLINVV